MNNIHKIAVVRANSIGDFCFSIPALEALRAAFPQSEIVLLGKRWHYDFLTGRPGPVDRVAVIPPYGGVSAEPGTPENADVIEHFFQTMQAEHFDLAMQLHGGGRFSNPFTLRLKARITAGLQANDAPPLDYNMPYIYYQSEILRYLEAVSLVGARPVLLEPVIRLTANDKAEVANLRIEKNAELAVIHPGASDPRRRWPTENFAAVGRALAKKGATVAIIGCGEEERKLVRSIADLIKSPVLELCDKLTVGGSAALLARSRIFIGNDSGPLHIASAVGTSTVGIFWCGNLINGGQLSRKTHRPVLSWRLNCPVCNKNTISDSCTHRDSFVADASADEAIASAISLWDAG